jgi:glycosyltransferase involved in cell wall biosynthesis
MENALKVDGPRVLFILPAFNEVGSVARVVNNLRQYLPDAGIVVIDDGSTDGTSQAVPSHAVCLRLPFNLGIGGAVQTGYRYAHLHGYDIAVQVDADGQHPADQVQRLLTAMREENADLVIGTRFFPGGDYRQSTSRMAGIVILRNLIRVLTGIRVSDCTSGFRAANRRVIEAFAHWYPEDYPEPEVSLLVIRHGFKLIETPVHMDQRTTGTTSISTFQGVLYVVKVSAALILDMVRTPWPRRKVTA